MILLDTQVCIWWSVEGDRLAPNHRRLIDAAERDGIGISAITVWEVAMLVAKGRIELAGSVEQWLDELVIIPTMHVVPASPRILIESANLPGEFHKDPADRIIVATARSLNCVLLTSDGLILKYEHVRAVGPDA